MVNEQSNESASSPQQEITIKGVTRRIASMFHQVSGLPDFEERACSYYCVATWCLNQINPFPLLYMAYKHI